jgi:hypothetical protein
MKLAFRVASIALCLAACRPRPLTSEDAGGVGTVGGVDASGEDASGGDAGVRDAGRDWVAIDTAAFLACASDEDCVATWNPQPVASVADCYCRTCAWLPLNAMTDATFAAQWQQSCAGSWLASAACPVLPCFAPPKIACVAGLCTAGSWVVPSVCPAAPTGGCPDAVACGGHCCAPGEWCDDLIGCRCGSNLACPVGQTCGQTFTSNAGRGFCGDVCCFDCAP